MTRTLTKGDLKSLTDLSGDYVKDPETGLLLTYDTHFEFNFEHAKLIDTVDYQYLNPERKYIHLSSVLPSNDKRYWQYSFEIVEKSKFGDEYNIWREQITRILNPPPNDA